MLSIKRDKISKDFYLLPANGLRITSNADLARALPTATRALRIKVHRQGSWQNALSSFMRWLSVLS